MGQGGPRGLPASGQPAAIHWLSELLQLATCRPVIFGGCSSGLVPHMGAIFMPPGGPMGMFVKKEKKSEHFICSAL